MSIGSGSLAELARLRTYERHRLSSWDRSGGNADCIVVKAGECAELGTIEGAGCIKHWWVTTTTLPNDSDELVKSVLRMYWDGEKSPSVETPLGDFFGMGFGRRRNFVSLPLQMSPESGKSMNCWFAMPFATGARFTLENQGTSTVLFYYYIDYESYDAIDPDLARFHASWNRMNPSAHLAAQKGFTRSDYQLDDRRPVGAGFGFAGRGKGPWSEPNLDAANNYTILAVKGSGQYVGCVLNIDVFERQVNDWYGEGDDMIFVDDDAWPPRLHGTGTEDYFNTAFCPTQEYSAPYHGITLYSGNPAWPWGGKNSMYRFHVEDPVRFRESIRVTIETGHANALGNDYSSTAYWYQEGRVDPLPRLPKMEARLPRPDAEGLST